MSEPKRYEPDHEGEMRLTPKGNYVLMEDYARLKAEVGRLREAGDEVVSRIQVCTEDLWCSIHRWNAAREGKQP
jgi:hypothetical protein